MVVLIVLASIAVICMIVAYIETHFLRVSRITVHNDKAAALSGRRFVFISDLHNIRFGKDNNRLFSKIIGLKPDFVLIGGDIINGFSSDEFEYSLSLQRKLKDEGITVLYTYGNHEQKLIRYCGQETYDEYTRKCEELCTLLNNNSVMIGDVQIAGLLIPPYMYKDRMSNVESYFDISDYNLFDESSSYRIMIAHDPSFLHLYEGAGADLTLCGHVHGGIIRLPFIGGLISPRLRVFPKYTKGYFPYGKGEVIVSAGIGWHTVPFRFCNDPEIVCIEFATKS